MVEVVALAVLLGGFVGLVIMCRRMAMFIPADRVHVWTGSAWASRLADASADRSEGRT